MSALTWLEDEGHAIWAYLTTEEAALIKFFGPLFQQIIAAGSALGKETVHEGVQVILDGAMSAATSAATAAGDKVAAAEAAFVSTVSTEGLTVVHNAEAGAIKAAVAVVQSAETALAPPDPTPAATVTAADSASTTG